jgi:large subunit ribosomal protein L4
MATVDVKDPQGEVLSQRDLPADLFEARVSVPLMHQVVTAGAAAQRAGTHSTKTRGEVSGGGVKPWRQKGTGRARQGSIRAPQWTGGGISHGPKPRDYSTRVNRKMRQAALRSALTDSLVAGKIAVVDGLSFDGPRTKDAVAVLAALQLSGRILLVIDRPNESVEKSFRNLPHVRIAFARGLGTYELLYADRVLFTTEALDRLSGAERPVEEPDRSPRPSRAPTVPETEPATEPAAEARTEPEPDTEPEAQAGYEPEPEPETAPSPDMEGTASQTGGAAEAEPDAAGTDEEAAEEES